jgi:hypothetical protein
MGVAAALTTLGGCELAIGGYPRFRYNAFGGGAVGTALQQEDGNWVVSFPPDRVIIPALSSRTGRLLGVPLPPGLQIAIEPEHLSGVFDPSSGALELHFRARFLLQLSIAGTLVYRAPALLVETKLSTTALSSRRHQVQGRPCGVDHTALLVGVANVPRCGAAWLDRFLGLPDEALAVLECQLSLKP